MKNIYIGSDDSFFRFEKFMKALLNIFIFSNKKNLFYRSMIKKNVRQI